MCVCVCVCEKASVDVCVCERERIKGLLIQVVLFQELDVIYVRWIMFQRQKEKGNGTDVSTCIPRG